MARSATFTYVSSPTVWRRCALVKVGEQRAEVESRIGDPVHDGSSKNVYDTAPLRCSSTAYS